MRLADVRTLAGGADPADATYYTGSRKALAAGRLQDLHQVIALDVGPFIEGHGQCGVILERSQRAGVRQCIAVAKASTTAYWGAERGSDGRYVPRSPCRSTR